MFGLGKIFGTAGKETVKGVFEGVGSMAGSIRRAITGELPPKMKAEQLKNAMELEKIQLQHARAGKIDVFNDIQQSRLMYAKELEKAPWLVRLLNGLVRPLGGLGALATVFFVIWAPYFGYPPLQLPDLSWDNPIWAMISGIISFFFVLRHKAQIKGVKDK